MKVTFVLAALATFAMAAPADDSEESGAVAKGDFSALDNNQEFSLLDNSGDGDFEAQAYCGGFSHAGCRYACGVIGTRCYMCTASTCNCNNWVC